MVDKLNRKLTLIFGALTVAVIALALLPFRLGLDLRGGTRLTYSVDLAEAREQGLISGQETDAQAIEAIIKVWRDRVDPKGVSGVTLRKEGSDRIVIELPGSASIVAKKASAPIGEAFDPATSTALVLEQGNDAQQDFPATGGRIDVAGQSLRYARRVANSLLNITADEGSVLEAFPAGTEVKLEASDPWRQLIENTGRMEVMMHATSQDASAGGFDLVTEENKAKDWVITNPNASISQYNEKLATENKGTALGRLRFFPRMERETEEGFEATPVADRLVALIVESDPDWLFSGGDFDRVFPDWDERGAPAVGFRIAAERHNDFESFTTEHKGQQMAIIIDQEIATDPTLNDPLRSGGIITGGAFGFRQKEVNDLVRIINSGSLDLEPQFEDRETVGATLGGQYIRMGFMSVVIGLIGVLVFIVFYYKRLGVYAAISLVFNLVLLMGAMAMLQATLTLPGVAGIILTVGMAVDANILIYERIREEALRGRRPGQSAKDGFANALSTIVDANLTTLITAIILYNFGSGPVQGFATTLIVGILTSMFSALVATRVMIHYALEKGVDEWKMARLVQDTNIDFMGLAKKTAVVSVLVIVAGVAFFSVLPRVDKYSIEFLGGNSMQVVTANAMATEDFKQQVTGLGEEFATATVQPLLSSADGDGFRKFQVEFKTETSSDDVKLAQYRSKVEEELSEILASNRFELTTVGEGGATGKLFFEGRHAAADVQAILAGANMGDTVNVTAEGAEPASTFSFEASTTDRANALSQRLVEAFNGKRDSGGNEFALAQPIPQSASVGPQVVQELRDDAILAILLSLFAVVMYIRVRFAEYSYGFAAVIALVHDVLVTLGFLALAISTGLINAQISLVMIAAFLTIIGYSLNDTIVVFDRIRENLAPLGGKMKLSEIINKSINQTLARTVLTSLTTLVTVVVLFVLNVGSRSDLEGFAYAVVIGVIVGTYSSMFVASPSLLWLETRRQAKAAAAGEDESRSSDSDATAVAG